MKVCVTAGTSGLDAPVDPRFGRCPFFVVVDGDALAEESVPNQSTLASAGAGIQAAQTVGRAGSICLDHRICGP